MLMHLCESTSCLSRNLYVPGPVCSPALKLVKLLAKLHCSFPLFGSFILTPGSVSQVAAVDAVFEVLWLYDEMCVSVCFCVKESTKKSRLNHGDTQKKRGWRVVWGAGVLIFYLFYLQLFCTTPVCNLTVM